MLQQKTRAHSDAIGMDQALTFLPQSESGAYGRHFHLTSQLVDKIEDSLRDRKASLRIEAQTKWIVYKTA